MKTAEEMTRERQTHIEQRRNSVVARTQVIPVADDMDFWHLRALDNFVLKRRQAHFG